MRRLLIADIHATLPALEAVLADAGAVDETICLGDTVGYGPHPAECIELLRSLDGQAILGNHDLEVLQEPDLPSPGERDGHQIWLQWTYDQVTDEQRSYLASLPTCVHLSVGGREATVVHGAPSDLSLHPAMPDAILAQAFVKVPGEIILFGHYHRPFDRQLAGRRLFGLKAIGQAGDRDPRAGYAIETDGIIEHRCVSYDIESVVRDLQRVGLPRGFQERWLRYMRSAYDPEWSHPYCP